MKKICTKCAEVKNIDMFYNSKVTSDGKENSCKECRKKLRGDRNTDECREYNRKWYEKNKESIRERKKEYYLKNRDHLKAMNLYSGWTSVYYLPEEHYIGISSNVPSRISHHKLSKMITEGYEIIAMFERHVDAHVLETMFHQRGYNGYNYRHSNTDKGNKYAREHRIKK